MLQKKSPLSFLLLCSQSTALCPSKQTLNSMLTEILQIQNSLHKFGEKLILALFYKYLRNKMKYSINHNGYFETLARKKFIWLISTNDALILVDYNGITVC